MTNLAALLDTTASKYPERTAMVFGDSRFSYAQLDGAANQVANLLVSRGIVPGDKVAISIPNVPYFTIVYYGILKAGAAVVPLNVLLTEREVAYHLDDSDAVAYFAFEGTPELPIGDVAWQGFNDTPACKDFFLLKLDSAAPAPLEPPEYFAPLVAEQPTTFTTVERADDDTAVILYTSGTTGQPKGAELTNANLRANAALGESLFAATEDKPDTYLAVLPLFHIFGQTVIQNSAVLYGGTIVYLPRFEANAALGLLLKEKITFFAGVPTMYWGLLQALAESNGALDVHTIAETLRVAASGGAALPAEIHHQFEKQFGIVIQEGYGLSETSPVASFGVLGEEVRVGSIGKPVQGVQLKLINADWTDVPEDPEAIGEIAIKGHGIMKGYYGRPAATADAIHGEWFRTGDLARKDEDGYYYIVDRSKDMIIRGGYNVYPRELEEVLMTHPAVSLVAVIGVPHDSHGEEVKAVVVKNAGDPTTEAELRDWGKQQFAAYKYPRIVEFRDALPMTATGKILKREIK